MTNSNENNYLKPRKAYQTYSPVPQKQNLIVVDNVQNVKTGELVYLTNADDEKTRKGRVVEISGRQAIVQILEYTQSNNAGWCEFTGNTVKFPVSEEMLGRKFMQEITGT